MKQILERKIALRLHIPDGGYSDFSRWSAERRWRGAIVSPRPPLGYPGQPAPVRQLKGRWVCPSSSIGTPSAVAAKPGPILPRSEEHTSELQSLMRISYAVFCLKKKNQKTTHIQSKH